MEYDIKYTAYITLKDGRRIYARDYGLKCFCIRVPRKEEGDK